jgi:hypothetical protein
LFPPTPIPPHLIGSVVAATIDERFGQAEGHRRVVGLLARLEPKWTAADHVGERHERSGGAKLHRRSDSVPGGKAQKRAPRPVMGRVIERSLHVDAPFFGYPVPLARSTVSTTRFAAGHEEPEVVRGVDEHQVVV